MDDAPHTPSCPCFRSPLDAGLMYITPAHHETLAMVRAWRNGDRPVLVLTGESGTGKTTFARKLTAVFGATMQVGLIDPNRMHPADLRRQVPKAFGSGVTFSPQDPLASHEQFTAECRAESRRRLLIVDEAQDLPETALHYLEQLTNPPRSGLPVFFVLLIGGPRLRTLLDLPDQEALRGRTWDRLHLSSFTEAETAAYVDHRLRMSNCSCPAGRQVFETSRLEMLHEASGGRPKTINRLVQRILFDPLPAGGAARIDKTPKPTLPAAAAVEAPVQPKPAPPLQEERRPLPQKPAPVAVPVAVVAPQPARVDPPPLAASPPRPAPVRAERPGVKLRQKGGDRPDHPSRRGLHWGLAAAGGLGLAAASVMFLAPTGDLPASREVAAPPLPPAPVAAPPAEQAAAVPDPVPVPDPDPDPDTVALAPEPEAPPSAPGLQGAAIEPAPDADSLLAEALAAGGTDPERAAQLYTRAALWGSARAAYYLGQLYETGIGVPENPQRAGAAYALALGVEGAEARLAVLADRSAPDGFVEDAPIPEAQMVFSSGQAELHWRDPEGAIPTRFRVEFVSPGNDQEIRQQESILPALLIDEPVARWRVSALGPGGSAGTPSEWSELNPALR